MTPHFKLFLGALLGVLVLMLALGCSGMQPRLSTPADYIGANYASIQGIANTLSQRVESGLISPGKAEAIYNDLSNIKDITDEAKDLLDGGFSLPEDKWELLRETNRLLLKLERNLQEQANE